MIGTVLFEDVHSFLSAHPLKLSLFVSQVRTCGAGSRRTLLDSSTAQLRDVTHQLTTVAKANHDVVFIL